jgi:4-hydroxyphenylpyruvate dioxygenase-like putative hemolysin
MTDVSDGDEDGATPGSGADIVGFRISDERLRQAAERILAERSDMGVEGLVGGLEFVRVNVEPKNFSSTASGLLAQTGYDIREAFEGAGMRVCVLGLDGSADILLTARLRGVNPHAQFNVAPKAAHLPNTRLEAFAFGVRDAERYVQAQKGSGARFRTGGVECLGGSAYVETIPSELTGASVGMLQRNGRSRSYMGSEDREIDMGLAKPEAPELSRIGFLDHTATRVRAADRDQAICEFLRLTNFRFEFAIYVGKLNSITSVTRMGEGEFAMVFTSGIRPESDVASSGPTEAYIRNYGTRVHHMAFATEDIEGTVDRLRAGGMRFISKLAGSPEEGLRQIFSEGSPSTLLVNEYIHRYGHFDGFFTKSNVTELTRATGKQ